jgi:hypothetical protein
MFAVTMLVGTSAFAEIRRHEGTSRGSGGRIERGGSSRSGGSYQPRERGNAPRFESRGNIQRFESRDNTPRFESRGNIQRFESRDNTRRFESRGNIQRFESRDNTRRFESRDNTQRDWRGNTQRFESRDNALSRGERGDRFRSVDGWRGYRYGAPYRNHERVNSFGRVDRFVRHRHGYRVWIGGGLYPIFIPFAHWRIHPLRVGLYIRFGGYWDPLGYWSVYDYSPYDGYYGRYDNVYTSGDIRGVVESVDFRRGTLVINDDISRQFVTVTMPRDRRIEDVRPGDYVEFSGDWTRGGIFNAYRLERLDAGRY